MEEDEKPIIDTLLYELLDERVTKALLAENDIWNSEKVRIKTIELRCHYAGYETRIKF